MECFFNLTLFKRMIEAHQKLPEKIHCKDLMTMQQCSLERTVKQAGDMSCATPPMNAGTRAPPGWIQESLPKRT